MSLALILNVLSVVIPAFIGGVIGRKVFGGGPPEIIGFLIGAVVGVLLLWLMTRPKKPRSDA